MKSFVADRTRTSATTMGPPRSTREASSRLGWPAAVTTAWALALAACAQPEVLALEHEVYAVEAGVETLVSSGCDVLPDEPGAGFGFGFGTGPAPGGVGVGYSVSYEFENELVRVSAGGSSGPSTEVEYDEAFLRSGGEDELVLELADDFALRLVNRAVNGCGVSVE